MTAALDSGGLDLAQPHDTYRDYCLWPYDPPTATIGKLRSSALLRQSFALAGVSREMNRVVAALQRAFGPGNTVWGLKLAGGRLAWEYYVYDYARLERTRSIATLTRALAPFVRCDLPDLPQRPYFMVSIEVDPAMARGERPLTEIHVYIGNPGSQVSSGICYALTAAGLRLDNFYFFFDAARDGEDVRAKVLASAHLDLPRVDPGDVLDPAWTRCKTIVVANKADGDAVYFSRIDVDQLIDFLNAHAYPDDLTAFVVANRDRLDHLLYDIGMDYAMDPGGRLRATKTGFYGTF